MGEVNLIKQALLNNFHEPAVIEDISKWKDFMEELKKRNIPINIHSDLGNNNSNTKFLYLMEEVLKKYPENKIVWAHMGLSKELSNMKPENHIKIMKRLLDNHPKLMLDITWRVLEDNYFKNHRRIYTRFFNDYSERILPGTDFVASSNKNFESYKTDLEVTSQIHKYLSDEAFRNIVLGNNYFKLLGLDYEAPEIFISN
jgi:predicted TIM-barrel fold metal-dependent hydrolase